MDDRPSVPPEDLAALVGSRLCHDLVNPLGAIGNGVELLDMTGAGSGPEMTLIRDAVRDAQARIRFFRIAFGAAGAGQEISAREAHAVLDGLHGAGRLRVTWLPETSLPRVEVRLAFLMLNCAETALPMGGAVTIARDAAGFFLSATAPRVVVDHGLWHLLEMPGAARDIRPAEVQFALLRDAARALGRAPQVTHDAGTLTIRL